MTDHKSANFGNMARTVSVSAVGSVLVEPNVVRLSAGVVTEAEAAKEALARNTATMAALIDGLKGAGITSKNLQTSALSIAPRYRETELEDERSDIIVGCWASSRVEVTLQDVTRVGELLDLAVSLGANQIGHISFGVVDSEGLMDEARLQAMARARQRGELYAKAAGAQLGSVLSIAENAYGGGPSFYGMARTAEARSEPPIEPGVEKISVQVHVVYALC
jgi:uncharacterized protein YggE